MIAFRRMKGVASAAAIALAATAPIAVYAQDADRDSITVASADPVVSVLWTTARSGSEVELRDRLTTLATGSDSAVESGLLSSIELYEQNLTKREGQRTEQLAEVSAEMDEHLGAFLEIGSRVELSKALRAAVELQMLSTDKEAFFEDARIISLLNSAAEAAKDAEAQSDWIVASELFFRLNAFRDVTGEFRSDVDRLARRLGMIRLYTPERLWELRNQRRLDEGLDGLPPYNAYGDNFHDKLAGIGAPMVYRALLRAATNHVQRRGDPAEAGVDLRSLLEGGLDAVRVMITTTDLQRSFAGLRDERARSQILATLDRLGRELAEGERVDSRSMRNVVETLIGTNVRTIGLPEEALLHEFTNGAMSTTDAYTAVIWPDELARFRRSTQGEFTGVGIQIQLDELQNIEVVTPLEGTPAQRAGIRAGDVIKKVDGISAVGLGLDQAVEVITGPANTEVTLTMERPVEDGVTEVSFKLKRAQIDLPSVKGWEKTGPGDEDWNWFIDDETGIGYVRLTGFTDDTTRDFDRAVAAMRASPNGLHGLILDLRYNPGGLLDQAVSIGNRFVDEGLIVRTETATGLVTERQNARRIDADKSVGDLPVVVLINEGSASASEIVAGAIQAGARNGHVQALVVGQRSFGKGSVQNVFALSNGLAAMKLTTQYYKIDAPRLIHREPGSTEWGIEPDLHVEMLPSQQEQALLLRRDADVLPLDESGNVIMSDDRPDPDTLLTEGIDLQAQTALVLLQSQAEGAIRSAKND